MYDSVTEASVHVPIQRNSTYIQTVRRSIYKTRRQEHPHSPICQQKRRPQGPPFTDPLHGILNRQGPTLHYGYVYVYSYYYDPVHLHLCHDHHKNCNALSRFRTPLHQVSDASHVIGISSFTGHSFRIYLTHNFQFD